MEIKGPGSNRPLFNDGVPIEGARRPQKFEALRLETRTDQTAAAGTLPGVRSQWRKADLKDPGKRDAIIRAAVAEIMEREFPVSKSLSEHDRANLIGWMSEDPLIQTRVTSHLERTLE